MTKRERDNWTKAKAYYGILNDSDLVLHHKDPSWKYEDPERYAQWNPEDLVVMTRAEHARLHGIGRQFSEETRKKISESNKNREISEESRRKMSESAKARGFSEEQRQKMIESNKGKHSYLHDKVRGSKWYTDGVKSIRLKPDDIIPEGFIPGRVYKTPYKTRSSQCDIF